jgi:intracellular sulfur oxidation DsrE/DsrF family protein
VSTRKDFIIASSLAASLAPSGALAAVRAAAAQTSSDGSIPPFAFDRSAFDAASQRDVRHRHSYASNGLEDALVLETMNNVLNAYEESLAQKPASVTSAAVLYHGNAIFVGFNDRVWNELFLPAVGKASRYKELSGYGRGSGNPWLHKTTGDSHDASIETLGSRGAVFFVCNNATAGTAHGLAEITGRSAADVYALMTANLVPNAMLVPAGVWAIHALQESHFTYEQVTL